MTLSGLAAQSLPDFRVVIADQSDTPVAADPLVATAIRLVEHSGRPVSLERNLPRRGLAQQRAFLLSRAERKRALFLDDDVWLEPSALGVLTDALATLDCGFVGFAVQGLSYLGDRRPHEQIYEEWTGEVRPERVRRGTPAWDRHRLHNAANLTHLAERVGDGRAWQPYKIAWIGGCVFYDREKLAECGGFDFWTEVPPVHSGEDVVAELRVMERYGAAGLLPSRAYHLELPTTVPVRDAECYDYVIEGG
ncbi:glycosyltransferase [Bailinhaonella thermotolerans]|uniref:Glycosyltransferase n=2 Tax=Bailinhaonella thermotolerans TaxID=1070861 RepID=A0A3A4B1J6_9ACTN|nr:glycosyltransferase [Bailinhaonella thermotolerans]